LRYLSEEQTEVATITEDDISAGTLVVTSSTTEDVVTKLIGTWKSDYAAGDDNKIILRHNVNTYGIREREINFFIYNIFELVVKSSTFWLIRLSNIWKHIQFTTFLDNLAIETFDTVKFDFNETYIASTDINGIVLSTNYDSDEKSIEVECWLPVKLGTMTKYNFAEPHDISVTLLFPTQDEIDSGAAGGDGPGKDAEGGLEFSSIFKRETGYVARNTRKERGERIQGRDYGEERPSDLDDTKPSPAISQMDVGYGDEPSFDYTYKDYSFEPTIDEPDYDWSYVFPGVIVSKINEISYNVNVYMYGLGGEPSPKTVKQLQISSGAEIPIGTWVPVMYNRWTEIVDGESEEKSEFTMQVPVWL